MSESHTNFLGIPVEGDITRGDKREKQRPIEDLQPMLQAVLADPFIVEIGWKQYTPYFNDGDPCTFSINTPWCRTTADAEDADGYDLEYGSGHPTLGDRGPWDSKIRDFAKASERTPEVLKSAKRVEALGSAIEGGEFEDVLLEAFGDHAEITVKATGITVKYYEHD